jgi:hypothetical protein
LGLGAELRRMREEVEASARNAGIIVRRQVRITKTDGYITLTKSNTAVLSVIEEAFCAIRIGRLLLSSAKIFPRYACFPRTLSRRARSARSSSKTSMCLCECCLELSSIVK